MKNEYWSKISSEILSVIDKEILNYSTASYMNFFNSSTEINGQHHHYERILQKLS